MSEDRSEARTEHRADTEVSVQLSGCGKEDVRTVFTVLEALFAYERSPELQLQTKAGAEHHVWVAEFEVEPGRGRPSPMRLDSSVTAVLQGTPLSVSVLRQALSDAFSVQEEYSASGDQERQASLVLESRTA